MFATFSDAPDIGNPEGSLVSCAQKCLEGEKTELGC